MEIVRFSNGGICQFVYFNWRKFRFETSCWARSIDLLFGLTKTRKHKFIGLYEPDPRQKEPLETTGKPKEG